MSYIKLSISLAILIFSGFAFSEPLDGTANSTVVSEIGFISDEFYVPLRSSPCPTCKIVHKGLKSGTKLYVHEHEEDWSLVSTESGYRGWIRRQHLTTNKIARAILAENSNEIERLYNENRRLELDMQNSFELVESLRAKIATAEKDRKKLAKELTDIKLVSSKEIALNEKISYWLDITICCKKSVMFFAPMLTIYKTTLKSVVSLWGVISVFNAILTAIIPHMRGRKDSQNGINKESK